MELMETKNCETDHHRRLMGRSEDEPQPAAAAVSGLTSKHQWWYEERKRTRLSGVEGGYL